MSKLSKFFSIEFVVVVVSAVFIGALTGYVDSPIEYQDALTKECVAIETWRGYERCTAKKCEGRNVSYVEPGMTYEEFVRRFD